MTTVIMGTTARVIVPVILVVAISLFLQGHNHPGGGFIGGVLTVAAFAVVYVAYDLDYLEVGILGRDVDPNIGILEHRTVSAYRRLFTFGLVVVVASGIVPVAFEASGVGSIAFEAGSIALRVDPTAFGGPFLAQSYTYVQLPLFGEIELASALLFDVGIYCIVGGGLLSILSVVGAE